MLNTRQKQDSAEPEINILCASAARDSALRDQTSDYRRQVAGNIAPPVNRQRRTDIHQRIHQRGENTHHPVYHHAKILISNSSEAIAVQQSPPD